VAGLSHCPINEQPNGRWRCSARSPAALFFHEGFREDGFHFKHVFDVDPAKVGTKWNDVVITHQRHAEEVLRRDAVQIAVVAFRLRRRLISSTSWSGRDQGILTSRLRSYRSRRAAKRQPPWRWSELYLLM
jgi:hypothetical protein